MEKMMKMGRFAGFQRPNKWGLWRFGWWKEREWARRVGGRGHWRTIPKPIAKTASERHTETQTGPSNAVGVKLGLLVHRKKKKQKTKKDFDFFFPSPYNNNYYYFNFSFFFNS